MPSRWIFSLVGVATFASSHAFQLEYPYADVLSSIATDVEQCSAASGFAFRNASKPTNEQMRRMCPEPSCTTVLNKVISTYWSSHPGVTTTAMGDAFLWFGKHMLNYCWYARELDVPCSEAPGLDLISHYPVDAADCTKQTGLDLYEESENLILNWLLNITIAKLCDVPSCVYLSARLRYLQLPCGLVAALRDPNSAVATLGVLEPFCRLNSSRWIYSFEPAPVSGTLLLPPLTITSSPEATVDENHVSKDGSGSVIVEVDSSAATETPENIAASVTQTSLPSPEPTLTTSPTKVPGTHAGREATPSPSSTTPSSPAAFPSVVVISTKDAINQASAPRTTEQSTKIPEPSRDTDSLATASSSPNYVTLISIPAALILLLAVGVILMRRRRGREYKVGDAEQRSHSSVADTGFGSSAYVAVPDDASDSDGASWTSQLVKTVPSTSIEDIRLLGTGGHAVVYLVRDKRSGERLASKRLAKNQISEYNTATLLAEIELHSALHHPRIVTCYGATWTNRNNLQGLFEYMGGGDLRTYLDKTPVGPWTCEKLSVAIDIAEALVYIHSMEPNAVVHRDLKSRNILLTKSPLRAKLTDFGISRPLSEQLTMTTGIGTSRWMAPEVITGGGEYGPACDIYSFGVVLSEIDTHRIPFADYGADQTLSMVPEITILTMVAQQGLQPTLSATCPQEILVLVQQCLSYESTSRPNAHAVLVELKKLESKWLKN